MRVKIKAGDFRGTARIRYARARSDNTPDWEFNETAPDGGTIGQLDGEDLGFERPIEMSANTALTIETGSVEHVRSVDTRLFIPPDPATGLVCVCEHPPWLNVHLDLPEVIGLPEDFTGKVASERLTDQLTRTEWQFPFPIVPSAASVLTWWPSARSQAMSDTLKSQAPTESSTGTT